MVQPSKKAKFVYRIGSLAVCRDVFCVALGLAERSWRIVKYESMVRRGVKSLPPSTLHPCKIIACKSQVCRQFFRDYILKHAEMSPKLLLASIDRPNLVDLFSLYHHKFPGEDVVSMHTFKKIWYSCLSEKLPDPEKHVQYDVCIRRRQAVGFKMCDTCCVNKFKMQMAKTSVHRAVARLKQENHIKGVRSDREELSRIRVHCALSPRVRVGFTVDAGDSNKFGTPTTKSTAKVSY